MAHVVDDGAEGSETGVAKAAVDINQWLKTNRLDKLKGYFEDNQIAMEDLVETFDTRNTLMNTL